MHNDQEPRIHGLWKAGCILRFKRRPTDSETGALYARPNDPCDFGDKIETLLDSESLRTTLGESGRRRVEEGLNWQVQSAKLVTAFDDLLGDESRASDLPDYI